MFNNFVEYKDKVINVTDIPGILKPGTKVYLEQGPAEPLLLVKGLMSQVQSIKGITLIIAPLLNVNQVPFSGAEYTEHWRIYTFFGGPPLHKAIAEKRIEYVPVHLSEIPCVLEGYLRPDIALIQTSYPDSDGYCSLGPAVDYNRTALDAASVVIAQLNENMPFTCGDSSVHLSEINYVVEGNSRLIQVPPAQPGETEMEIADYVSSLVSDGSTIQIGIGSVPNAVLSTFVNKRDLGIHSGMLCDQMIDLIEAGAITGKKKNINPRKVVGGVCLGTNRLYDYCNNNPFVELYPTTYTHNRKVICQLDNFVSINSAVEIDLAGQVNTESAGGKLIGGVGGQVDFMRISRLSKGGKSILAFASTVKGKSKIIPNLRQGVPVSTARADVDYVVTEYGIADLRYRSLKERAGALIKIAHPEFRNELKQSLG